MSHNRYLLATRAACAVVLSCLLALGPLADGFGATRTAYAADSESAEESSPAASVDGAAEEPTTDATAAPERVSQDVPIANEAEKPAEPVAGEDAHKPADKAGQGASEVQSGAEGSPDRVASDVPLEQGDAPAKAGVVVVDGLKYQVNSDGQTAVLVGWLGNAAPEGDVAVAARVVSGADSYRVTAVAEKALVECDEVKSVALPESIESVGKDAFKGCAKLASIDVAERNERYASHDGMLFNKDLSVLLLCPEGKGCGGGGLQ